MLLSFVSRSITILLAADRLGKSMLLLEKLMQITHDIEQQGTQRLTAMHQLIRVLKSMLRPNLHKVSEHRLHVHIQRHAALPVVALPLSAVRLYLVSHHVAPILANHQRRQVALVVWLAVRGVASSAGVERP